MLLKETLIFCLFHKHKATELRKQTEISIHLRKIFKREYLLSVPYVEIMYGLERMEEEFLFDHYSTKFAFINLDFSQS